MILISDIPEKPKHGAEIILLPIILTELHLYSSLFSIVVREVTRMKRLAKLSAA